MPAFLPYGASPGDIQAVLAFHGSERSLLQVGGMVVARAFGCTKTFSASRSHTGLLPQVDFLVPPEIFLQSVALPTHLALVGPSSGVKRLVFNEVALLREALPALGALARAHPDVDGLVAEEVGFLIEGLLALGTLVWFLLGVDPLVPDEVGPLSEALPAVRAFERLAHVDPLVPDELPVHAEALPALAALIRPLAGVDLPVSGEV